MDDIKDYKYDSTFHKERAVQKGIISTKKLKKILILVLSIELLLQLLLPKFAIYFYIFLIFYSFLMFKNFFNNNLAKKHFFLFILLHQFIFAFYIYYYFSIFNQKMVPLDLKNFIVMFFLFLTMYIYEISRKSSHRFDENNEKTNDTYIYKWGKNNVLIVLFSFIFLQIICLLFTFKKINTFLIIYVLLFIIGISFSKIREKEKYFILMIISGLVTFISYYFI